MSAATFLALSDNLKYFVGSDPTSQPKMPARIGLFGTSSIGSTFVGRFGSYTVLPLSSF